GRFWPAAGSASSIPIVTTSNGTFRTSHLPCFHPADLTIRARLLAGQYGAGFHARSRYRARTSRARLAIRLDYRQFIPALRRRLREQFLQPFGDLLGGTLVGEAGGEAALRIHHVDDRAVVHRIVTAGFRMLRIIDPIGPCCLGDLLRGP